MSLSSLNEDTLRNLRTRALAAEGALVDLVEGLDAAGQDRRAERMWEHLLAVRGLRKILALYLPTVQRPARAERTVPAVYPMSTSKSAMYAECRYWPTLDSEPEVLTTMLSTTQPRRALRRFIAWAERRYPGAARYEACFPQLDIYEGVDP